MASKSFVIYDDWQPLFMSLPSDKAGELIKAIFAYRSDATAEPTDPVVNAMFQMIKKRLDDDSARYEAKCARNKEIAIERERNRTNVHERTRLVTDNDNDNNKKDIKERDTEKEKRTVFARPTVEDVKAYCRERGNSVDAQTFVDFYSSKGWKVGNSPMKDWKACVRTWEKREKPRAKPDKFQYNDQRDYDYDELERRLLAR